METLMRVAQDNGSQTPNYPWHAMHVIDRDFDLLRARAWERSAWAAHIQRVQEIVVTVMAIALGSLVGWMVMR